MTGIYLGSLDGSPSTRLVPDFSLPTYLAAGPGTDAGGDGWLLWGRAGTLLAQRLDVDRQTLVGDPHTLAGGLADPSRLSVAAPGLVAYRVAASRQRQLTRQLTWVDRSGTSQVNFGDPDPGLDNPRVSPDGRRVVVGLNRSVRTADLWLLDGTRMGPLTFDAAADLYPLWSPDGTQIVFRSNRTGAGDLYRTLTNGAGGDERVVASTEPLAPTGWSPDGRYLLYMALQSEGDADLWVVPMEGDRTPSVFLKTPFREAWAAFSPDGRWVAYHSNASGRHEVYVRPFVPPGASGTPPAAASGQWQVSTAGGIHPVWGRDGRELFYLNPAGAMMAAPITVVGNRLEPGDPRVLFATGIANGGVDTMFGRQYDVAPDGRFLINVETMGDAAPITLIQHWNPEAKK